MHSKTESLSQAAVGAKVAALPAASEARAAAKSVARERVGNPTGAVSQPDMAAKAAIPVFSWQ
jgi:anti-sigma factor ChrR (cupin superfamily)